MSDAVDRVIDVSGRLRELRDRLAQLDQERAALQQEMDRCMELLPSSSGELALSPPPGVRGRDHVLDYFRRRPASSVTPLDLHAALPDGVVSLVGLRTLLGRMADEGLLTRIPRGFYILRK